MTATDGLAALNSKKRKGTAGASRQMPPPRHSAPPPVRHKETDVAPEPPDTETEAALPAAGAERDSAQPRQPAPAGIPTSALTTAAVATAPSKGRAVSPSTIYFDEGTDDYLEEVAIAGRRGRPKIDSRSAFARLAVRRMMEQLTPEQAVEILRSQARSAGDGKAGRPLH